MLRKITGQLLAVFALCSSPCFGNDETIGEEPLLYVSVFDLTSSLTVMTIDGGPMVTFGHVGLDAQVSFGREENEPTYLIVDELSLAFYVPEFFNDELENWSHEDCDYSVLESREHYRADGRRSIDNNIEQVCASKPWIVRYLYSAAYGLQAIVYGVYLDPDDRSSPFKNVNVLVLWAAEKGFGAKIP